MTRGSIVVGVVVALPSEARAFTGRFEEEGVRLRVGGIGPDRARAAAEALLAAGARSLVSFGIAGGLAPTLAPGAVLVPERVLALNGAVLAADAAWAPRIRERLSLGQGCTAGSIAESVRVLANPSEKRDLFRATAAQGVDMESAAVAAAAHAAGVPFVAVRAVCDAADMTITPAALRAVDGDGRLRPIRLLLSLVRSPGEIVQLRRLSSAAAAAHAALRTVVRALGCRLLAPA